MGRPKALLPFRDGTFLSILSDTLNAFCDPIVAVFGFNGEALSQSAPREVKPVVNPHYREGMLTSLQTGLRTLDLDTLDRILFTLVDHPAILPGTIASLLASDAPIAIPRLAGRRGHPVIVTAAIAREFLAEPTTAKVRYVIDRHVEEIEYMEVPDPGINDDIDDPELYHSLLQREAAQV